MSYHRLIQIEFNHCDPAGIVFYPRYFEMTNSVVENFFADVLDCSFARMMEERGGVPTARIEVNFHAPSRLGKRWILRLRSRGSGPLQLGFGLWPRREGLTV